MAIHSRADIHPSVEIHDNVDIGPGVVISENSIIKSGVVLGPHVVIGPNTTLHEDVTVSPGAIIGTEPQDLKFDGSATSCEIGPRTVIREYATINRGTNASGTTIIGSDCMLMSYVHVAHDCRIGDQVILANAISMGGHCEIHNNAVVGGNTAMHQFVRVGSYAMIGGMSGLRQDAPPFMITAGPVPATVYGINSIGLKRNGFKPEARKLIKLAFKILYRSNLVVTDAVNKIRNEIELTPEIEIILEFFENSKRGVSRGHKESIGIPQNGGTVNVSVKTQA